MSRVENSKKNMLFSLVSTIFTMALTFVNRTIFIHTLGLSYLGLNGLFTNVLSFLAIAELGIGNAISFSLYKPLATNNSTKIASFLNLFRISYRVIGIVITAIGLCLVPFLDVFVNLDEAVSVNYTAIYLLFLANTVLPYFCFSYKSSLLYADQKTYIVSKIDLKCNTISIIIQFLVLLLFRNYYLYLIVGIVVVTIKNYILAHKVNKLYPVVQNHKLMELTTDEKRILTKNVFSLSLTKISGVVYSSTDNIIISTFINTITVGLYSNYTMIVNMIKSMIASLFNAITASVGNLNAEENQEHLYVVFKRLDFINFWVYGFLFICLNNLINIFISVWVGKYALFNTRVVLLISLMFLIPGLNNVVNIYKDACGLYWQTKYRAVATAIVNLGVSLVLVQYIGIEGVFWGTIIAYLTTIYVKDPVVVYKECFQKPVFSYYVRLGVRVLFLLLLDIICQMIVKGLDRYLNGIILFFVAGILLTILINVIFILIYHKTSEYKYFYEMIKKMILKDKRN